MSSEGLKQENSNSLELGDIIQIIAPTNQELHENIFLIDYIDENKIKIINVDQEISTEEITLNIQNFIFMDKSITQINLLDRSQEKGYIKQNNIEINNWLEIKFNTDIPIILTGQVTNIEEDMIEIKTWPKNQVIYIDFAYKGLPEAMNIEYINTRSEPDDFKKQQTNTLRLEEEEKGEEIMTELNSDEILNKLRQEQIFADSLVFDDDYEAEEIRYKIEVEESEKRYDLDEQLNDLLNDMISKIDPAKKNSSINKLNRELNRFIELREKFSNFYGNNLTIKTIDTKKPLIKNIKTIKDLPMWIIPIVKNKKIIDANVFCNDKMSKEDCDRQIDGLDTDILEKEDMKTQKIEDVKNTYKQIFDTYYSSINDNKYIDLLQELKDLQCPFDDVIFENALMQIIPETDILALIENSNDFSSPAYSKNGIINIKFNSETYFSNTFYNNSKIKGDNLNIVGFIIMPINYILFSNVKNISSSLLSKSLNNLNFLYLNNELKNEINDNFYDDGKTMLKLNNKAKNYFDKITNHRYLNDETQQKNYDNFLNGIIPSIKDIASNINQQNKAIFSMHNFISTLNIFMIDQDNITKPDENAINKFIKKNIANYFKFLEQRKKEFSAILNVPSSDEKPSSDIYNLFSIMQDNKDLFLQIYNLNDKEITDSEKINIINKSDSKQLFTTMLALNNINLFVESSIEETVEGYKLKLRNKEKESKYDEKNKECANYVIAKQYETEADLFNDNDKEIYYDIKYDNTPYILKNDYINEFKSLTPEDFYVFLKDKLINNLGFSEDKAELYTLSIIEGKQIVAEGVYAFVNTQTPEGLMMRKYFVRRNNKWVEEQIDKDEIFTDTNKTLCDIQLSCATQDHYYNTSKGDQNDPKCNYIKQNTNNSRKQFVDDLLTDFKLGLKQNKEEVAQELQKKYTRFYDLIEKQQFLNNIKNNRIYNDQIKMGLLAENIDPIVSPNSEILSLIFAEEDFTKRQNSILQFCEKYCREPTTEEDEFWLYCTITNVKLIPSFFRELAHTFVNNNKQYLFVLNQICFKRGDLSEDGDAWIDKHSGYKIKNIEANTDEGYESGFKKISRSELIQDEEDKLLEEIEIIDASDKKDQDEKYVKIIKKLFKSLKSKMNISFDTTEIELMCYNQVKTNVAKFDDLIEKKQDEKQNIIKRDTILLLSVLSHLFIAIQTNIPSIKTKHTFPGCVRSFSGFPLEDNGTKGIDYIACISKNMRTKISPWNIPLLKSKEKVIEKIIDFINKYILNKTSLNDLLYQKRIWLRTNKETIDELPIEYRLETWKTFQPALKRLNFSNITKITSNFQDTLNQNIKRGKRETEQAIDVLKTKMFFEALYIQGKINYHVATENPLLQNKNAVPFLINACCNNSQSFNTVDYFVDKDKTIIDYNSRIKTNNQTLEKMMRLNKARIIFDNTNTKSLILDFMDEKYDENIIYKTFIHHCKYDTTNYVPEDIQHLCEKRPDEYKPTMNIFEKIRLLKSSGINYDNENLNLLLNVINNRTSQKQNLAKDKFNEKEYIKTIIEELDLDDTIDPTLSVYIKNLLQIINKTSNQKQKIGSPIENVIRICDTFISDIEKQVKTLSKKETTITSKVIDLIRTIMTMDNITNDILEKIINLTFKLTNVYPNVILNKIEFKKNNIPIHWNLSLRHQNDVSKILAEQYVFKKHCFDNPVIIKLINALSETNKHINILMNILPKTVNDVDISSENVKFLHVYLLLYSLQSYLNIKISSEESIVTRPIDDEELTIQDVDKQEVAEFISNEIIDKDRTTIIFNYLYLIHVELKHFKTYDFVIEKVNKEKVKEKDEITDYLKGLSEEEREVKNLFKNNKLEEWSVGLKKSLVQYDKDAYDKEMEIIDEKRKQISSGENLDDYYDSRNADEIEREELAMTVINDDDVPEGFDGDEQY